MKKIVVNVTVPLLLINSLLPPTLSQSTARPRAKPQEKTTAAGQPAEAVVIGNLKLDSVLTLPETLQRLKNQLSQQPVDATALAKTFHHLARDFELKTLDPADWDEIQEILHLLRTNKGYDSKTLKKLSKDLFEVEAALARVLLERRSNWRQAIVKLEAEVEPTGGAGDTASQLGQYWTAMSGRFHFGIKDTDL